MLSIRVKNKDITLAENTGVTINANNPAFDQNNIERVFSFPFKIAAAANNTNALLHINRPDALQLTEYPAAELVTDGIQFQRGIVEIGTVSDTEIQITFKNEARHFLDNIGARKIADIIPTIQIPQTEIAHWEFSEENFQVYTRIVINNIDYVYDPAINGTPASVSEFIRDLINADFPNVASAPSSSELHIDNTSYFPFEVNILPSSLTNYIFFAVKTTGEAVEQNLYNFISDSITNPREDVAFPCLLTDANFYGDKNQDFEFIINHSHPDLQRNVHAAAKQSAQAYIPFYRIKWLIEQLALFGGLSGIAGEFDAVQELEQLLLFNNHTLDRFSKDYVKLNTNVADIQYINCGLSAIEAINHLPEMNGKEFMTALLSQFNLYGSIRNNTLYLSKSRAQIEGKYEGREAFVQEYSIERRVDEGFILRFKVDDKEPFQPSNQLQEIKSGAGVTIIELPMRPLYEEYTVHPSGSRWRLCRYFGKGSSKEFEIGKNDYNLRYFFERGLQPDSENVNYLMSGHHIINELGDTIGSISLRLTSTFYDLFWKGWIQLIAKGEEIDAQAMMSAGDVSRLMSWQRPYLRFRSNDGFCNMLIKSFAFKTTNSTNYYTVQIKGII